jgi:phosphoglycerate dehydrogenase-like enzyme
MTQQSPVVMLHTDVLEPALNIVQAAHPDLRVHGCDTYAGLERALADTGAEVVYSVRFAGSQGFPRAALLGAEAVRWLSVGGSGTDHIAPWNPDRLTVTNAAGAASGMIAEYALGAMLSFSLSLRGFARAQQDRQWTKGKMRPISGQTLLIVGLGHTGRALAKRAKALDMTVIGLRAHPVPTENVDETHRIAALAALLPRADFVTVCVPLLPSTRGLIGADALAVMKPGAVLVDVSRGGVVDGQALVAALQAGRIAGAALDVFETEPLPPEHPFWTMQNVILTPHCSSVYDGWDDKAVTMFAENLGRYRRGAPLENIVDPEQGN